MKTWHNFDVEVYQDMGGAMWWGAVSRQCAEVLLEIMKVSNAMVAMVQLCWGREGGQSRVMSTTGRSQWGAPPPSKFDFSERCWRKNTMVVGGDRERRVSTAGGRPPARRRPGRGRRRRRWPWWVRCTKKNICLYGNTILFLGHGE